MTAPYWGDDDDAERRRREQAAGTTGGAQTGAPSPSGGSWMTFSQMQQNGMPRPAPPTTGLRLLSGGVPTRTQPTSADPNPAQPEPGMTPFGQSLMARYQNYRGPGGFQSQTGRQGAPVYRPGTRPMQGGPGFQNAPTPYGRTQVPGGYAPGVSDARYNRVGSPMMRETGGFSPGQSAVTPQLQQMILRSLQNPSAYGADAVQQSFNRLSGQIDDDFRQQETSLEEDMARRGLADSSIRGGRLQDLNVAKRSARTELADRLVERQAETQSADTARAIAQAMGFDSQGFNQGLAGYQANLAGNAQNFQQDLASRAFEGDQNAMEVLRNLDVSRFNRESGQMGFENEMSRAGMQDRFADTDQDRILRALGFNNQTAQQGFENELSVGGFNRQLGLDEFGAGMDRARFAAGEDQRGIDNAESAYGLNLGADQQGFNQEQALLNSLLGYQQQGFDNSLARDSFDADNAYRQQAMELSAYLQTLGLGSPGAEGGGVDLSSLPPQLRGAIERFGFLGRGGR